MQKGGSPRCRLLARNAPVPFPQPQPLHLIQRTAQPRLTSLNAPGVEREELPVDVCIVGAGPAGLACAIHLQRLLAEAGDDERTILVLDKAEEIGHHTLSGAVMDPKGIAELFPTGARRASRSRAR